MARQLAISDVGQLTVFLRVSENTGWGLGFERLLAEEINFLAGVIKPHVRWRHISTDRKCKPRAVARRI